MVPFPLSDTPPSMLVDFCSAGYPSCCHGSPLSAPETWHAKRRKRPPCDTSWLHWSNPQPSLPKDMGVVGLGPLQHYVLSLWFAFIATEQEERLQKNKNELMLIASSFAMEPTFLWLEAGKSVVQKVHKWRPFGLAS